MKIVERSRTGACARDGERGYALLFVLLMASVVGLYLYTQLPRVAFESERDKEQTLIDRGEQYKRAIQLYVKDVKKFPQKIEDLENTNNIRYLRKRYIDPYTGKDEWRLIHVNAAGQLTDSLVQKPPCGMAGSSTTPTGPSSPSSGSSSGSNSSSSSSSSSFFSNPSSSSSSSGSNASNCTSAPGGSNTGTASASANGTNTTPGANGTTNPNDPNNVNAAVRQRPSDLVGAAYTQGANADPNDPSTWAPISLTPVNANGGTANGQPPTGAVGFAGGLPGQNNNNLNGQSSFNGVQTGTPGQTAANGGSGFALPGQPGFNPTQNQFKIDQNGQLVPITQGQTGTSQTASGGSSNNGVMPAQQAPAPGSPFGLGAGGMNPAGNSPAAQNQAVQSINQMMTNPNAVAGANGLGTAGMVQGGIAGVASNYKGPSIKVYATRQKYQEWEFVFSMNQQQNGANGQNKNPLQPGQNGLNPTTTPGQNGTGTGTGSTTGTGTTGSTGN